jgi:hypothetical protein
MNPWTRRLRKKRRRELRAQELHRRIKLQRLKHDWHLYTADLMLKACLITVAP